MSIKLEYIDTCVAGQCRRSYPPDEPDPLPSLLDEKHPARRSPACPVNVEERRLQVSTQVTEPSMGALSIAPTRREFLPRFWNELHDAYGRPPQSMKQFEEDARMRPMEE